MLENKNMNGHSTSYCISGVQPYVKVKNIYVPYQQKLQLCSFDSCIYFKQFHNINRNAQSYI